MSHSAEDAITSLRVPTERIGGHSPSPSNVKGSPKRTSTRRTASASSRQSRTSPSTHSSSSRTPRTRSARKQQPQPKSHSSLLPVSAAALTSAPKRYPAVLGEIEYRLKQERRLAQRREKREAWRQRKEWMLQVAVAGALVAAVLLTLVFIARHLVLRISSS